eukprot:3681179-Alexandrium_andersonii.AAC.1
MARLLGTNSTRLGGAASAKDTQHTSPRPGKAGYKTPAAPPRPHESASALALPNQVLWLPATCLVHTVTYCRVLSGGGSWTRANGRGHTLRV